MEKSFKLYSFDVFDTLITRKTATPFGIFAMVKKEIEENDKEFANLPLYLKENFAQIRAEVELCAALEGRKEGNVSVDIEYIYKVMSRIYGLNSDIAHKLCAMEIEKEMELSIPIMENIEKIKELYRENKRVVLISDMYLNEKYIRNMLARYDSLFENITIYVSCDCNKLKSDGKLFAYVQKKENVKYEEWLHCGDNINSDVNNANQYGINAVQYEYKGLHRKVRAILNEREICEQIFAGAEKNVRLAAKKNEEYEWGTYVGSFILIPYVYWILDRCVEKKIKNLYFIARDGYIIKKIADVILKHVGLNISTHYLYGSREAWRLCNDTPNDVLNVEDLLKSEKAKVITDYLNQELSSANDDFAFVDVQGTGVTEEWITKIINKKITTFFLYMPYFDMNNKNENITIMSKRINGFNIIELLTRAPHGKTIGYTYDNNKKVIPKFDDEDGKIREEYYYNYEKGIIDVVEYLQEFKFEEINKLNIWGMVQKYFVDLINYPDKGIADFIGEKRIEKTVGGKTSYVKFAPKLTDEDMKRMYLYHDFSMREWEGYSISYSDLRNDEKTQRCKEYYISIDNKLKGKFIRIKHYGFSQIKKELFKKEKIVSRIYSVNCDELSDKVALYGAGRVGKEIYQQLNEYGKIQIVGWYDKNADSYKEIGMPVENIDQIDEKKFDQIIICVKDESVANNIKNTLLHHGIPNDKIYWNDYMQ